MKTALFLVVAFFAFVISASAQTENKVIEGWGRADSIREIIFSEKYNIRENIDDGKLKFSFYLLAKSRIDLRNIRVKAVRKNETEILVQIVFREIRSDELHDRKGYVCHGDINLSGIITNGKCSTIIYHIVQCTPGGGIYKQGLERASGSITKYPDIIK